MWGLAALTVLLFGCLVGVASAREVHVENGAMVYNAAPEGAFLTIKDYNGRPYLQDASTTVGPGCHNEAIPNQNDPDGPPEEVTFCDGVGSVDVRGTEGYDYVRLETELPGKATLGAGNDDALHQRNDPNTGAPIFLNSPVSFDGGSGNDHLVTGNGPDVLTGGPGMDLLEAHGGDDKIFARDGEKDGVVCGAGADTLQIDAIDAVNPLGCEGYAPAHLSLKTNVAKQKLGKVLKHGLKVKASASKKSTLRLTLMLTGASAKTLGFTKRKKAVVVGKTKASVGPKSKTYTVKLSRKAKVKFKRLKQVKLVLTGLAQTSNDDGKSTRRITLKR